MALMAYYIGKLKVNPRLADKLVCHLLFSGEDPGKLTEGMAPWVAYSVL